MLSLLFVLYPGNPSIELVKAIMVHDSAERMTSDLSAPTKWKWPKLNEAYEEAEAEVREEYGLKNLDHLAPYELQWLKALDGLELYLWCHDQAALGNKHTYRVAEAIYNHLRTYCLIKQVGEFLDGFNWDRSSDFD
jgi:5'-deoxynucleotidase YfbR-like HD superfamily hydrolase